MAGFKRTFATDPGRNVLSDIEAVNVIDVAPPARAVGAGVGTVCMVGEFEDGPFDTPIEVFGGSDLLAKFGGLGFARTTGQSRDPVARRSGGDEAWNGNGFIQLRNKRFSRLMVVRANNSAGQVELNRLATHVGGVAPFDLSQDLASQVWQVDATPGPDVFVDETADFNSFVNATLTPFPGTENVGDYFAIGFTEPFSRITFDYANGTAGVGGVVVWEYWNGTAWAALAGVTDATAGFTTAVADNLTVSWTVPAAWQARVLGSNSASLYYVRARITTVYTTNPVLDQGWVNGNGKTLVATPDGGSAQTATWQGTTGRINGSGGTYPTLFAGGETLEIRIGTTVDNGPLRVVLMTAAEQSLAQVVARINAVLGAEIAVANVGELTLQSLISGSGGRVEVVGGTALATLGLITAVGTGTGDAFDVSRVSHAEFSTVVNADMAAYDASVDADGRSRIVNSATDDGTGTSLMGSGSGVEELGFTAGESVDAAAGADVTIPAGTRIQDSTTLEYWVTVQSIATGTEGGPFEVGVRPADDDDGTLAAAAGDLDTIVDVLPDGFAVTNAAAVTRLTVPQIDAAYIAAIEATIDANGVAHDIDVITSARSSESIMRAIRSNADEATRSGHHARKAVVSPRHGLARDVAKGSSGQGVANPGVGRTDRVVYAYPNVTTQIPEVLRVGEISGGIGFTDDGVVQVHADMFYAMVRSNLPPEENAGQRLNDTNVGALPVVALEDAFNTEKDGGIGLTIDDYKSFKAAGICAPRFDRVAGLIFQSDVTSVDPNIDLVLADANRRYMADFVINSVADIAVNFVKKLNTPSRRRALIQTITGFLRLLQSPDTPEASRIESFLVEDASTAELRELGFMDLNVKVRMFGTMKYIVARVEVGTTVVVEEAA